MEPRPLALYLFESFDLVRRCWVKARHVAALEDLGRDGAPFRIVGAPERREVRDPSAQMAGHLAAGR